MLKGEKRAFTDINQSFTENIWQNMLIFLKLDTRNLVFIDMVHLFNALALLLFVAIVRLFSNIEEKKDNEVFHDVLQVYHKDSVPTVGPRYPTDLQRILSNK